MKPLEEYTSIEELKQAYKRAIEYYMRLHVIADNVNELAMTQMTPDAFLFFTGTGLFRKRKGHQGRRYHL